MALIDNVPGSRSQVVRSVVSQASNAADTAIQAICRVDRLSDLKNAYWIAGADWTWTASNYRTLHIVNMGLDGLGTTIIGTYTPTVSKPKYTPLELTIATDTLAVGTLLGFNSVKVSTPQDDLPAGTVQLEWGKSSPPV